MWEMRGMRHEKPYLAELKILNFSAKLFKLYKPALRQWFFQSDKNRSK